MSKMDRRDLLRLGAAAAATALNPAMASAAPSSSGAALKTVEQWGLFELPLTGPASGNPFKDVKLTATFANDHRNVRVTGFYDGEGTYRVRFMPGSQGEWRYETKSNRPELDGKTGRFEVVKGPSDASPRFEFCTGRFTGLTTYNLFESLECLFQLPASRDILLVFV